MKMGLLILSITYSTLLFSQPKPAHNLKFDSLAKRWDEAIPLGNGWLGALIWQKGDKLRMSLDRVDLWDDRPMPEIDKLKFKWVVEKVKLNQYDSVQRIGDEPYEKYPAPTKIPGAAIEFDLKKLGKVVSNELDIKTGLSVIKFDNGVVFNNYIHAVNQVGYFGFENLPTEASAKEGLNNEMIPELMIPNYNSGISGGSGNSVEGQGPERLGYRQGTIVKTKNSIRYHQPTWNGNYYEVLVQWFSLPGNTIVGQWTISNNKPAVLIKPNFKLKEPTGWPSHLKWWNDYWNRSSVSIPDPILERQYYLDMYKFGCVARANTPPISLQAIWTADNGNLPPWKGDFHHDLNTQLSYWPGYASNHLDLTAGYTNWLWKVKEENKRWTKQYFELDGLNVPGVTTISGKPMGGWIQYSMSPTTSAWLAQHFYWQWKYGKDYKFLKERAFPYIDTVAHFLNAFYDPYDDEKKIQLSSSPEYYDNSIKAWFRDWTNYDLSLVQNLFDMNWTVHFFGGEENIANFWHRVRSQLPELSLNESGLTVAPGQNLDESHRHHSPYMAIYPLGLLNVNDSIDKDIINKSLRWIEKKGTRNWCGYSFSWMGCIYARAQEGESAADMLKKFATNFVSTNSFHLNGDQKGGQYSSFTYRPFTLEGNFAFAQGIHEMLIQSHKGYIEIFPSIPKDWHNISFNTLRTESAFLVSAKKENNVVTELTIKSEAGADLFVKLPFTTWLVKGVGKDAVKIENGIAKIITKKGQIIIFTNAYE
jgi:alpha-L-fucosidase 2